MATEHPCKHETDIATLAHICRNDIPDIKKTVEKIFNTLEGNGGPGLKTRVHSLEQAIRENPTPRQVMFWVTLGGGGNSNVVSIQHGTFHSAYDRAIEFNGTVTQPIIKNNRYGGAANVNTADIVAGSASTIVYDADIEADSIDFSAATCDFIGKNFIKIGSGTEHGSVNISQRFQGDLYLYSDTTKTFSGGALAEGWIHEVDTGISYRLGRQEIDFNDRTTTLGPGATTLTAAALLSGYIFEDPEGAATWTTDTAANIVAAIPHAVTGSAFTCYLVNAATNASSEVVTIAGNTGVTLRGEKLTLTEGTNITAMVRFVVTNIATPAIDAIIITE